METRNRSKVLFALTVLLAGFIVVGLLEDPGRDAIGIGIQKAAVAKCEIAGRSMSECMAVTQLSYAEVTK